MHIKWKFRGIYIIVIAIFIFQLIYLKRQPSTGDGLSLADTYNLVNSVLPIVTVGLLYLTFKSQNEQLQLQKTATAKAQADAANARVQLALKQVEDRFFNFLEIHRGNVKDMTYRNEEGKRVFIAIVNKFTEMFGTLNELLPLFVEDNELSQDLTISEKIEIAYLLIFYGCTGENSTRMIAHALSPFDKYVVNKSDTFAGLIVTQLE